MSFLNGNCCLKLNYFICGSKDFSSKKKKFKLRKKSFDVNGVHSNKKMVNSLPITLCEEHNINIPSEENDRRKLLKSNKMIKSDSSLNSSIDDQFSSSILNNEIITKNIILHRHNPTDRLGLTLCYGLTSKLQINIYIEQVDKQSIAHCQGKLQRGDQIIKINNQIVTNRDQAIQLIKGNNIIILQIIRFKFNKTNLSSIGSTITEDDSGVILACNTDLERIDQKYSNEYNSCLELNHSNQLESRRCLSLNDLTNHSFVNQHIDYLRSSLKDLISSQNLFQITTDNEKSILKPLPLNYQLNKPIYRRHRRRRSRTEVITTDDERISQFKQGRYWTKQQRKEQFQRSKQHKYSIHSTTTTTEDFNLLNRIFLRENLKELKEKPYLAIKYQQQSIIEKNKLKQIKHKYHLHQHLTSISNTTNSIHINQHHSPTIII